MSLGLAIAISSPRIIMGFMFLAAAIKFFPSNNENWMTGDIDVSAWLFNTGSWFYFVATCMDGIQHFQTGNVVKIGIFFIYLLAGLCVTVGSCFFLQSVQRNFDDLPVDFANHWYIAGGSLMLAAVLFDLGILLNQGKKIISFQIIAILSIVAGAMFFTVATMFSYPKYLLRETGFPVAVAGQLFGLPPSLSDITGTIYIPFPSEEAFKLAANLFTTAAVFFCLHGITFFVAVNQILGEDKSPN
jgi:hypothetical protein